MSSDFGITIDNAALTLVLLFVLGCAVLFYLKHRSSWIQFERTSAVHLPLPMRTLYAATSWTTNYYVSLAIRFGANADTASWLGFAMCFLTALAIANQHLGLAASFFLMSGFFDVIDGQIARRLNVVGQAGAVLDSTLDRSGDFLYHAGALWLWRDSEPLLLINLIALHGTILVSYTSAMEEKFNVVLPRGWMKRTERGLLLLIGTIVSSFTHDLETAWGLPPALPLGFAMLVISVAANWSAISRLQAMRRVL